MTNIEVVANSNIVSFTNKYHDFVIISRKQNSDGFGSITSSFPFTKEYIDRVESSKIISVESSTPSGAIIYRKLDFFTIEKATDIFIDLLEYHEQRILEPINCNL